MREHGLKVMSSLGDIRLSDPTSSRILARWIRRTWFWSHSNFGTRIGGPGALAPLVRQGAAVVSFQKGVHKGETWGRYLPQGSGNIRRLIWEKFVFLVGFVVRLRLCVSRLGPFGRTGARGRSSSM